MPYQGKALIFLLVVLVQAVLSDSDMCRNAVAPPSKPRGVNRVDRTSATPLFKLHLTPTELREASGKLAGYNVRVSVQDKHYRFSEATLAVSTNGSCGSGDFDFRLDDYTEVVQEQGQGCPRLIHTKRKMHMIELLPLIWIPPSCGCVTLRILVVESGEIHYAENEAVTNGPLAKTLCFQKRKPTQISREHRLDSLCHVVDKHSSSEILSRGLFTKQRDLETKRMDHLGLEMALELRRSDVRICCNKGLDEDKMKCFDDTRRRRIDEFCEDGIPDIPFRTFRRTHMRNLEKSCCYILGEYRYKCFAQGSKSLPTDSEETNLFDYSMDASDIVNDLAEFGSHEHLDSYLRPIEFGNDESLEEDDEDENEDDDIDPALIDDESDLDSDFQTDVPNRLDKRPILQRAPPKHNKKGLQAAQKPSHAIASSSPPRTSHALSQNNFNNYNPKPVYSRENRRLSSRERNSGQGSGRRKYGRRGSAERRKISERRNSAERRSSAERRRISSTERRKSAERLSSFERRQSAERRSSVERRNSAERRSIAERRKSSERRTSAERRSSAERRTSAERRNRLRKVSKERFDEKYSRPRPTKTRGERRPMARQPMSPEWSINGQYGFDDQQGSSSMDRTLKKLQKRMKKLKLLKMCCQAGADMGDQVYGGLGSVTEECRHSGDKFVRGVNLGRKTSKCASQFVDCCMEEAKKGLTMTSQEFIENTAGNYWANTQQYDPLLVGRVLSQRGRRPSAKTPDARRPLIPKASKEINTDLQRPPTPRISKKITTTDLPNISPQKKLKPSKQAKSVYDIKTTPPPSKPQARTEVTETILKENPSAETQAKSVDEKAILEVKPPTNSQTQTKDKVKIVKETAPKNPQALITDEKTILKENTPTKKQTEAQENILNESTPSQPDASSNPRQNVFRLTTIPSSPRKDEKTAIDEFQSKNLIKQDKKNDKDKSLISGKGAPIKNARKRMRVGDFVDDNDQIYDKETLETESNDEKFGLSNFGRQTATPKNQGNSRNRFSKEEFERNVADDKKKIMPSGLPLKSYLQKSTLSANTNTIGQSGGRSRNSEYEQRRPRGKKNQRYGPNSRRKGQIRSRFISRVVALDSREMAERNTRQFMDALDSREMADQYIRNNNYKNYNNKKRRGRMYRKGTRNYRYAAPSLNNERVRFKFG